MKANILQQLTLLLQMGETRLFHVGVLHADKERVTLYSGMFSVRLATLNYKYLDYSCLCTYICIHWFVSGVGGTLHDPWVLVLQMRFPPSHDISSPSIVLRIVHRWVLSRLC